VIAVGFFVGFDMTYFVTRRQLCCGDALVTHTYYYYGYYYYYYYYYYCSYLLNKDPAPAGEHCKCVLTIEHRLYTCTKYEHSKKQYFLNSPLLHVLLHVPNHDIFNYLASINLFNYKFKDVTL